MAHTGKRKLRVGVIDLTDKGQNNSLWGRIMNPNLAGIMPQVAAVWCEELGHDVTFVCFTGFENLVDELPKDVDVLFISAFSQAALLAYAISAQFRARGAVTVLGGPHARCYPQDSQKYFDYVLGFTDKKIMQTVLEDCAPHRPLGLHLEAATQPAELPGVRERWKFIEPTLNKAPFFKIVPMIGSLGCPYTCEFCIDSTVKYQPLDFETMKEDLRFLLTKFKRPHIGWHDPNFGIRFDDYMDAIEEAVPQGKMDFLAESSLSILSEPHLQRLRRNGFKAILPGVESWYDMGNKSKSGANKGKEKVAQVSEHVNMILRYIPYIQTNFVLGLDCDEGAEPFELTKEFIDKAPGAFPGYSLLSAFGQAAPLNLGYQREDRVLPFPFHFLNNNLAMNVKPRNYEWPEFYRHIIDLTKYSFSKKAIMRRFQGNREMIPKWMNVVRAISSEGYGRIRYHSEVLKNLESDRKFRAYFEGETTELHPFYIDQIKRDLGPFWEWLPEGALYHNHKAYLEAEQNKGQGLGLVQIA